MLRVIFLLCLSVVAAGISQTPELFYEDGGDLGPIAIRDGSIYYIEHDVGLKELSIASPEESNLIVETDGIFDITHIFWGVEGAQVYFGNTVEWYKSPFDPNEVNMASFFRDFLGQHNFEIKQYNDVYLLSITDFGTFVGILVNIDPINAGQGGGFINSSSRNLALQENTIYFSHTPSGDSAQNDFALFRGVADDFNDTQELLFDFNEPIGQIEVAEDMVYIVLRDSNNIMVFDGNQDVPWSPLHTIDLDEEIFTLENIVINDGDIYFTDSAQGSIWLLKEDSLSLPTKVIENIEVSPNPVEDFLSINNPEINKIEIIDLTGKLISSYNKQQLDRNLDIRNLPNGLYVIKAYSINGSFSFFKILKK